MPRFRYGKPCCSLTSTESHRKAVASLQWTFLIGLFPPSSLITCQPIIYFAVFSYILFYSFPTQKKLNDNMPTLKRNKINRMISGASITETITSKRQWQIPCSDTSAPQCTIGLNIHCSDTSATQCTIGLKIPL